jgi:hypothetical protein
MRRWDSALDRELLLLREMAIQIPSQDDGSPAFSGSIFVPWGPRVRLQTTDPMGKSGQM